MKTRNFTCLQAIPLSFYSADLYQDVAKNWRWTTFFYMCLVIALCAIPLSLKVQRALGHHGTYFVEEFVSQAPPIMITEGVARTPEKKPYLIKDPATKEVVAMIDTTGQHTSFENEKFDVLVTSKSIMMLNRDDGSIKIKPFPETLTMNFDPAIVKQKFQRSMKWSWLILYPLMIFLSIVYRFLQALLYAAFGKLLAIFSEIDLMYETILRLTMVALTPTMIVGALLSLANVSFKLQGFLLFIIGIGYVFFAIRVNEKD